MCSNCYILEISPGMRNPFRSASPFLPLTEEHADRLAVAHDVLVTKLRVPVAELRIEDDGKLSPI